MQLQLADPVEAAVPAEHAAVARSLLLPPLQQLLGLLPVLLHQDLWMGLGPVQE